MPTEQTDGPVLTALARDSGGPGSPPAPLQTSHRTLDPSLRVKLAEMPESCFAMQPGYAGFLDPETLTRCRCALEHPTGG